MYKFKVIKGKDRFELANKIEEFVKENVKAWHDEPTIVSWDCIEDGCTALLKYDDSEYYA